MKRKFSLLLALLLCLLTVLSACQKTPGGEEDQTPQGENSDTPSNKIEELKLELYTENASSDTLLQLQEKLPQQVKDVLTEKGYDKMYGARPMGRLIQEKIKQPLAEELLFGKLVHGGEVTVRLKDNALSFAMEGAAPKKRPGKKKGGRAAPVKA